VRGMTDLRDRLRRASEFVSPLEPAYERLHRRRERIARNRRLATASFALVLGAGVLVVVFAALGRLGSTERGGEGPGAGATEEELALGPGQYFYEKTVRILPDGQGIQGGTVAIETWWSPDGSGRKEAELTTASYGVGPTGTWGPGRFPVMEDDLSGLSTDPDQLATQLRERSAPGGASPQPSITPGPGQDQESGALWRAVNDLFEMPNAVPELRAALFQVTAGIPGVRAVGGAVDPVGREAVALAVQSEGANRELFFDPETLQFMAKVENYGAQGTWYLIVIRAGVVDFTDERPEGKELLFQVPTTDLPTPVRGKQPELQPVTPTLTGGTP
jgi:hypothetical protein